MYIYIYIYYIYYIYIIYIYIYIYIWEDKIERPKSFSHAIRCIRTVMIVSRAESWNGTRRKFCLFMNFALK